MDNQALRGYTRVVTFANPPKKCNGCHTDIQEEGAFADARIPLSTCWGYFCRDCADTLHLRYGVGHGQFYELNTEDGKFHKTKG